MKMYLEFKWSVSRGRDTYGYNICSLYVDGRKVSSCNGGGYDMQGTALGDWVAKAYADRLIALKPEEMPKNSHWERAKNPRRFCQDCTLNSITDEKKAELEYLPNDAETCPKCGSPTRIDYQEGKTIDDGRYFYGLTYHDPEYNPGKAVIGDDCHDRTMGKGSEGKTVEQAEAAGESLGLERYQAFYRASSKHATERHKVPLIDGACGMSSVQSIMKAIGLDMEYIPTRSKNNSVYLLHDKQDSAA